MNQNRTSENRKDLERKLRRIWDNEEFDRGVICNAKTDKNWSIISQFIDMAARLGDDITSDDIAALSVVISREKQQEKDTD